MIKLNKIDDNSYHLVKDIKGVEFSKEDFDFIKKSLNKLNSSTIEKEKYPLTHNSMLQVYRVDTFNQNEPNERGIHFYTEDNADFISQNINGMKRLYKTLGSMISLYESDKKNNGCIDDANLESDAWSVSMRTAMYGDKLYPINISIYFLYLEKESLNTELNLTPDEFFELTEMINALD